jgi:cytochrome c553
LLISPGQLLMPKHIRRLLGILAVVAMLFVAGKIYFPPKSFGVYGHYRAASVEDIAAAQPAYLSPDSYSAAYPKEYETWSAGIHKVVKCQICHTTVGKTMNMASLAGTTALSAPATLPAAGDSRKLCVKCHEKIAGRPDYMPQIDVDSHSKGQACTACHNPHSPLFSKAGEPIMPAGGAGTVDVIAGKKLSATCAACHGSEGVSATALFPNLACQKQPYLAGALTDFQSGKRVNPVMGGIAKGLSPADIQNVAAYFSGMSCK